MRAEDIFWFNQPYLEQIGEEGRKKLIKLIQGIDKEPKPKKLSEKQLQKEKYMRDVLRLLEGRKRKGEGL